VLFFYTLYIAAINLWEDRAETSKTLLFLCSPILLLMVATDFVMQITVFALIFLDPPRELLVTSRLKRYRALEGGWRKHWADEICMRALNPFAPSKHHC
jgi:hypothetical protein